MIQRKHKKLRCTCDKDDQYTFSCKHGVVWFAQHVLIMKIRRLQKQNENVNVSEIILKEYQKCRQQYKLLKRLSPRTESAQQIERDLSRTFPKNKFF